MSELLEHVINGVTYREGEQIRTVNLSEMDKANGYIEGGLATIVRRHGWISADGDEGGGLRVDIRNCRDNAFMYIDQIEPVDQARAMDPKLARRRS